MPWLPVVVLVVLLALVAASNTPRARVWREARRRREASRLRGRR